MNTKTEIERLKPKTWEIPKNNLHIQGGEDVEKQVMYMPYNPTKKKEVPNLIKGWKQVN